MTEPLPYWKKDWAAAERALSDLDRDALERCVALTLAEKDRSRVEQVRTMLAERHWLQAAQFCSYHRQTDALRLLPWESPPSSASVGRDDQAMRLADKMRAARLSIYEADPVGALKAARRPVNGR